MKLKNSYEKDACCIRGDYTYINSTTLSVVNTLNVKSPRGPIRQGYSLLIDPKPSKDRGGGKLKLLLPLDCSIDYYIIGLSPINRKGKYTWSS